MSHNAFSSLYTSCFAILVSDFSEPAIALSSATTMSDPVVNSSSTVNIVSHQFAMKGVFVSDILSHCDVTVPADVTVRIRLVMFVLRRQGTPRSQCVQVRDGETVHSLCSAKDPVVFLECTDGERKIEVGYVTGDVSVSVAFEVQLQGWMLYDLILFVEKIKLPALYYSRWQL